MPGGLGQVRELGRGSSAIVSVPGPASEPRCAGYDQWSVDELLELAADTSRPT
ncbi:hypothetical protein [Plantactinospora endophytica]|uniref:hypothetical protein n=1 Tax=Plantactinospora endophytica TaxID=673535 RepID=UPI001942E0A0|nr:hypothetical protein [Plantactinospora endophytica]